MPDLNPIHSVEDEPQRPHFTTRQLTGTLRMPDPGSSVRRLRLIRQATLVPSKRSHEHSERETVKFRIVAPPWADDLWDQVHIKERVIAYLRNECNRLLRCLDEKDRDIEQEESMVKALKEELARLHKSLPTNTGARTADVPGVEPGTSKAVLLIRNQQLEEIPTVEMALAQPGMLRNSNVNITYYRRHLSLSLHQPVFLPPYISRALPGTHTFMICPKQTRPTVQLVSPGASKSIQPPANSPNILIWPGTYVDWVTAPYIYGGQIGLWLKVRNTVNRFLGLVNDAGIVEAIKNGRLFSEDENDAFERGTMDFISSISGPYMRPFWGVIGSRYNCLLSQYFTDNFLIYHPEYEQDEKLIVFFFFRRLKALREILVSEGHLTNTTP